MSEEDSRVQKQYPPDLFQRIFWDQDDMGKGSGGTIVPKLKREHIKLTSFSKMRVDLAAQVHIYRYTNTD